MAKGPPRATCPSPKQMNIWRYICQCVQATGRQPTQEDLAKHFHITPIVIRQHLARLQQFGYISRDPDRNGLILHKCKITVEEMLGAPRADQGKRPAEGHRRSQLT